MKPLLHLLLALSFAFAARAQEFLPGVKRILFLGDSITYSGQYVDTFEAFLLTQFPDRSFEVIDCGLPSETVSGLSEAGHADGKFPRPDLHERLDRVLALVKPDLVFACYGMNCGIYLPFDEARFAKYREGIEKLRAKVKAAGADIIHLTPAVFDPVPPKGRVFPADTVKDGQQFEGYDDVLARYADWLMSQKASGWRVIDTHKAMRAVLDQGRALDPGYKFAGDGVHPNAEGHQAIALTVIANLAPAKAKSFAVFLENDLWAKSAAGKTFFETIRKRGRILADSYLATAGHQRPGMSKGLPLDEAKTKAAELTKQIDELRKSIPAGR
jgi:lysophospholipase L1-like esterase